MRNPKRTLPVKVKQENVYEEAEQDQQPLKKRQEIDEEVAKGKGEDEEEEDKIIIAKLYNIPKIEANNKRLPNVDQLIDDNSSVMKRAEQVQANLDPEFPSFTKLMVPSHVRKSPWLGVPRDFYNQYLPRDDDTITLIGENGEKHRVNWLTKSPGLGSGWGKFSQTHKLKEGDAVIFQLVMPLNFKVYIVRKNTLADGDGADDNLNVDTNEKQSDVESDTSLGGYSNDEDSRTEGNDCLNSTGSSVDSQENCTKSFIDLHSFSIIVNGFSLDSELSESVRTKYYELCFSKKSNLHDRLLETVNPSLAAGMILATVNIAEAIRVSKIFTSRTEYAVWDKTLEGFQVLGMDVDFLRSPLRRLQRLAIQSEETPEFKRFSEAALERDRLEEEITTCETALNCLKQAKNVVESEIDALKKEYSQKYEEAARAPWSCGKFF